MNWTKPKNLLLLILPIFLVILSFIQRSERTNYHMYDTDPEYSYLFNGMNICNLASPAHVQGPGTPSQVVAALVIKVVHVFRPTSDTLNVDVMKNPDVYCKAINIFSFLLLAGALLFAGVATSSATGSVIAGMFIQLIPFTKWILLDLNSRIMVESMVIIGVVLLIPVVLLFVYGKNDGSKAWTDRFIIAISILIGFIASSKLVYVPIALVPFFVIGSTRRKTAYVVYSILAFFLFSFSIWFYWVPFRDWYITNFFHSGMYGAGQATIIDPGIFKANMKEIFLNDPFYLVTFLATGLTVLLWFIPALKLKKQKDSEFQVLLGIFLTILVLTLLASKQYKNYYLTVNYLLMVPAWFFILKIVSRTIKPVPFQIFRIAVFIVVAIFVYRDGPRLVFSYHPLRMENDRKFRESLTYVEENFTPNDPVLALPNYFGAPFKEYGVFYGMAWCGHKMATKYATDLNVLYPHIYFFHGWNNRFNQWGTNHSYIDLLKKYGEVTFYSGDKAWEESLKDKFKGINRQLDTHWSLVKSFDNLNQYFYKVTYDSLAANIKEYICDAEIAEESKAFFTNQLGQYFEGAIYQCDEFARSGNYSVKLLENQFGFTCTLSEVQSGEHYHIEIWRKIGHDQSALVVQSSPDNDFYISTSTPVATEREWEKLQLEIIIPDNLRNRELKIYGWNFPNSGATYFDDLSIRKLF